MKLFVYSIRDSAIEVFNSPFFARAPGEAERNFQRLCQDPNSGISAHPHHFDLYHLGTYDDSTGKMDLLDSPRHEFKAVQFLQAEGPAATSPLVVSSRPDRSKRVKR